MMYNVIEDSSILLFNVVSFLNIMYIHTSLGEDYEKNTDLYR